MCSTHPSYPEEWCWVHDCSMAVEVQCVYAAICVMIGRGEGEMEGWWIIDFCLVFGVCGYVGIKFSGFGGLGRIG